jgi:hypothetical protein
MRVLRVSSGERANTGDAPQGAVAEPPDVVVYGISPRSEVTSHAPEFRDMASTGAAIVVFCTSPDQAADFEDLGAEYLVDANEPARELAATVRAAYRHRAGQTIH